MMHTDLPSPAAPEGEPGPTGVQPSLLSGRTDCLQGLRRALLQALEDGAAAVWCVDTDYSDWPLDDAEVIDALAKWARPTGRSLHMIGGQFDVTAHRHPRFSRWRRDWSHRFDAWSPVDAAQVPDLPMLLVAGRAGLEVVDRVHWRGRRLAEPQQVKQALEHCEMLRQHCEPAWPATTLGL